MNKEIFSLSFLLVDCLWCETKTVFGVKHRHVIYPKALALESSFWLPFPYPLRIKGDMIQQHVIFNIVKYVKTLNYSLKLLSRSSQKIIIGRNSTYSNHWSPQASNCQSIVVICRYGQSISSLMVNNEQRNGQQTASI